MLLNKIVVPATVPGPKTEILCSREVLHVVALIINAIVREADLREQNLFYRELLKLFVTGESSRLVSSHQEQVATLLLEAEIQQTETVQVFVFAVAAMRKHVLLPHVVSETHGNFGVEIVEKMMRSDNSTLFFVASRTGCSIPEEKIAFIVAIFYFCRTLLPNG